MSWAERQADEAELERERVAGLDAECNRLRKALETQTAAVNTLEARSRGELDALRGARDAFDATATELRDILEGRTTPPTEAEMEAHEAAGGPVEMDLHDGWAADPRVFRGRRAVGLHR